MNYQIPFNKPFIIGNELAYIKQAVESGQISGDGMFSKKCHQFFEQEFGIKKALLTTSCTDALEMAAILLDIKEGDEIIAPSFTFVSSVNAFVLRGAKIVFIDSKASEPNIDEDKIKQVITSKTKAIIAVHYAGVACNMEKLLAIAQQHNLFVVEDAAQAINSYFTFSNGQRKYLGSLGHLAAFSFHETKNVIAGEGGLLAINDERFIERAEIIREKGTNRSAFFRGEIDKYEWVDIGSSFLPSEITAAFLFAQLEHLERVQLKRKEIWQQYYEELFPLVERGCCSLPFLPNYADNNAHIFYILCNSAQERNELTEHLKLQGIYAAFHYQSLHKSKFYLQQYPVQTLEQSERYSNCLLRLPIYFELSYKEVRQVTEALHNFYK